MRRHFWFILVLSGLAFIGAALASCAPDTSAPERQIPADEAAAEAPVAVSIAEPQSEPLVAAFVEQACLDCHTDEERLKTLAVEEEEEAESLSSGPG